MKVFDYATACSNATRFQTTQLEKEIQWARLVNKQQQLKLINIKDAFSQRCPRGPCELVVTYARDYVQKFSAKRRIFALESATQGTNDAHQFMHDRLISHEGFEMNNLRFCKQTFNAELTAFLSDARMQHSVPSHVWDDKKYRKVIGDVWFDAVLAAVYNSTSLITEAPNPTLELMSSASRQSQLKRLTMFTFGFEAAFKRELSASETGDHWKSNPLAQQRIFQMTKLLRESPVISHQWQGNNTAVWMRPRGYIRWVINEEAFLHSKPTLHADFFFLHAQIEVPAEKIVHLKAIADSITYYSLGKDCGAGCHFRGAGVATLSIVKEYAEGKLTLHQAVEEYSHRIANLAVENTAFDRAFVADGIEGTRGTTPRTDVLERYIINGG